MNNFGGERPTDGNDPDIVANQVANPVAGPEEEPDFREFDDELLDNLVPDLEAPTEASPEASPETSPEGTSEDNPEDTPENTGETDRTRLTERIKSSPKLKAALVAIAGVAATVIIALIISTGGGRGDDQSRRQEPPTVQVDDNTTNNETNAETEAEHNSLTGYEALDQRIDGSFLQYDNPGCYNDENKVTTDSVGNPDAVFELIDVDPTNATAEQRGAVQEYLIGSMEEPAASWAIACGFEGFEGLNQAEAEERIHNMSDEEKAEFLEQIRDSFSRTEWHYETASGINHNQFMEGNGPEDIHSGFVDSDLTGVRVLVGETTLEDGSTIRTKFKEDCGNIEIMAVRVSPEGEATVVIIDVVVPPETEPASHEDETTPPEETVGKDEENTIRIDSNIAEDIAENIGTGEVRVSQTPTVESQAPTIAPTPPSYEGTSATTVQNPDSTQTGTVAPTNPANNYNEDRGGANSSEYAPVQENTAADQAEIPIEQAPTGGQALEDILGDLGIN